MNPFNPDIFSAENPCVCCTPPAECACALEINIGFVGEEGVATTPYASLSAAQDAIADMVADCLAFNGKTTVPDAFTADQPDLTHFDTEMTISGTGGNGFVQIWVSVTVSDDTDLSIAFSGSLTGGTGGPLTAAFLFACDTGLLVMSDGNITDYSGTLNLDAIPAGTYVLVLQFRSSNVSATTTACTFNITSTLDIVVNPVIALWDDSGTTRSLWACPKLLLPPLTESTGDWYADCAAAQAAIDDYASNCVGWINNTPYTSFVATDGGSSLELDATIDLGIVNQTIVMWGSINLEAGDVLTVAFTTANTHGSPLVRGNLYDDTGTFIEEIENNVASGNLVFSAAGYTGRYTLAVVAGRNDGAATDSITGDFTATSSGTMSVNPIQALYDVGLPCPARLNCGDACP